MISYALIANGKHNPFLASPLPEHMVYPISQSCKNGIDLDYSALILGEQFIIDGLVFDEVLSSKRDYLKPMQHSLIELEASGIIRTEDYSSFFSQQADKIAHITDSLLNNDVNKWLSLEQKQWDTLKGELDLFQKNFGSREMQNANLSNIGIESWLARSDQMYNKQLRESLYLLFEKKIPINSINIQDVKGSLQFIVAQIVMSSLVSHTFNSPVLDWDDSKEMYDNLYSLMWDDYAKEINLEVEAQKLFKVVIPDLKPENIDSVIKFINNNKAVHSLRNTLLDLISNGEEVNSEWMTRYVNEIMSADLAVQKKSSILSFFGMLCGLLPWSWFHGVAISTGVTFTDKMLFRKDKKYEWYYALQRK